MDVWVDHPLCAQTGISKDDIYSTHMTLINWNEREVKTSTFQPFEQEGKIESPKN
jgi:hypothetical protein